MATYASTYGNPDWYKQQIDPKDAREQANRLGISTDQLFQLYAQTNMPNIGQPGQQGVPMQGQQGGPAQQWTIPSGGLRPTQNQMAQWASGLGTPRAPGAPLPQLISAVPSASGTALSGIYGPMATWQNVTGQGNQPASGTPGLGQFLTQAAQLSPQQFQFQVPQQIVPKPVAGQTVVPTAQPGAQPVPVKQYQSGGLVTQDPSVPPNYYGFQYPLYAQNAQGSPTGQAIYAGPLSQANLLGAAALQMPPTINQAPSGTPSSKSGVAPTPGALVGTGVPQVTPNWDMIANQAGLSSHDVAQLIAQGMTPTQAAQKFNVAGGGLPGPWLNPQIGSVFTPVARTAPTVAAGATPLQPAAQPTATAYNPTATPFAQAPPAPGIQIPQTPFVAAHTSALANAGQALFAHFGGDPASASPADITKFHNQLTDAITNYTAGATRGGPGVTALAAAPQPTAAKKMQRGGVVPGRGNEDTVPALLTPGEYVIPRPQVQQLMRTGRLPIKMAGGGTVEDPDSDPNAPPETRRKPLTTAAQTQSTPPPAAPGGGYSGASLVPGLATAAQAYASSVGGGGGGIPAGSTAGAGAYGTVGSLMAGQGSAGAAGSLGKLPATGLSSPGAQSALGGVGAGLSQAAQAIASSAQPWQPQQSAIPAPPPAPPAPQFTQQQIPQQRQGSGSPYIAYATYPASPYAT